MLTFNKKNYQKNKNKNKTSPENLVQVQVWKSNTEETSKTSAQYKWFTYLVQQKVRAYLTEQKIRT